MRTARDDRTAHGRARTAYRAPRSDDMPRGKARRAALVGALLAGLALPRGDASAQSFYGCSAQGNCEFLQFSISPTANVRGNYFASLLQIVTVTDAPAVWFGAELTLDGGIPRIGSGPDDIDHPFSTGRFFEFKAPGSLTEPTGAFFTAPSTVTSATLLIGEHPSDAPPGVIVMRRVALTQVAPLALLPEPATVTLVAGGLALMAIAARRRRA